MKSSWHRWKTRIAVTLAAFAFILAPWQLHGQTPATSPSNSAPQRVHLLKSSDSGIVLELHVPQWQVKPVRTDELQLDEIQVPGFSQTSAPGTPQLPIKFVTLGIPPGVAPQVQVLETDGPYTKTGYRLAANPAPTLEVDPKTPPWEIRLTAPPEPQIELASGDAFYPTKLAQVVEVGRVRSQRFVQIRLNPFQYHPAKQELQVYERLQVAVRFTGPALKSEPVDEGAFESILRSLLFNYAQARAWRVPPSPPALRNKTDDIDHLPTIYFTGPDQPQPRAASPDVLFRIEVSRDGMYELDRYDLRTPDQSPEIFDYPLDTFQLFEDFNLAPSSEVALEIVDGGTPNQLDFGDAVRFYGRGPDEDQQRYTGRRVYWLTAGQTTGRRMATRGAGPGSGTPPVDFPTTAHAEENRKYWSNAPSDSGPVDHWFWTYLNNTGTLEHDFTLSTPGRSPVAHPVTVRAHVVGYSSGEHYVKLYLSNGGTNTLIAEKSWSGQQSVVIEGTVAASKLVSGANTLRLKMDLPSGAVADAVFVNWVEADYRRAFTVQGNRLTFPRMAGKSEYTVDGFSTAAVGVYDITEPRDPVRLTGTQTDSSGTLRFRDAASSAQQYIATALQTSTLLEPDHIERVNLGADLRAPSTGADYVIITHADFTAAANRLASHRAKDFSTQVVQVQDIYNQFGNGLLDPTAIREFLAYAAEHWSPRPQYVVAMGDGTLDYRDYLGSSRETYIPPYLDEIDPWLGETADENYYASVIGTDSLPDIFFGRLPVNDPSEANAVVDKIINYEAQTSMPDSTALFVADNPDNAGDFPNTSEAVASTSLPDSYTIHRIYFDGASDINSIRQAIVNNINQGPRFINYYGHAGVSQWADEGLFSRSDVGALSNNKYPIVVGMTCLEGSFQDAGQDALAEGMLRAANKGAIASWSATGLGVDTGHYSLNVGFYDALFQDGVRRLGRAAVAGKVELYKTGANLDLIHTFALLGDPALDTGIQSTRADINNDGRIDLDDLTELQPYWHKSIGEPFDQDGNNFINIVDFMRIIAAWN